MTNRLVVFLLFCFHLSIGQNIEFGFGLSKYAYGFEDESKYGNQAITELGHCLHIGLNDIRFGLEGLEKVNFRFTLGINKSGSEFSYREGGQAGGTITEAKTQKTSVMIGVYPLNINVFKHFELNVGGQYLRTISSSASGSSSFFGLAGNETKVIDDQEEIFAKNQLGITGRIAYKIRLGDNYSLTPQYNYYLGLSKEFIKILDITSIQNHFFSIGFIINI